MFVRNYVNLILVYKTEQFKRALTGYCAGFIVDSLMKVYVQLKVKYYIVLNLC